MRNFLRFKKESPDSLLLDEIEAETQDRINLSTWSKVSQKYESNLWCRFYYSAKLIEYLNAHCHS